MWLIVSVLILAGCCIGTYGLYTQGMEATSPDTSGELFLLYLSGIVITVALILREVRNMFVTGKTTDRIEREIDLRTTEYSIGGVEALVRGGLSVIFVANGLYYGFEVLISVSMYLLFTVLSRRCLFAKIVLSARKCRLFEKFSK